MIETATPWPTAVTSPVVLRPAGASPALATISGMPPGQLLDAGLENRGGRPIYRVRWQTPDGRRIDYIVDAQTGQIIGRN